MSDITRILNELDQGCGESDELFSLVYAELRRMATAQMAREQPGQTLQPTGLVHETWLRLAGNLRSWDSRAHFFAAAAESMRRILVDRARRRNADKRGGQLGRVDLDLSMLTGKDADRRLLRLDAALSQFTQLHPQKAELVKLRFFAGCSIREAARLLDISTATADRHWAFARAWLQTEMADG